MTVVNCMSSTGHFIPPLLIFPRNYMIDIWLVFISFDFEMRFDNFTPAACILYIEFVETLNFQLRCLVEKLARINNGKTSYADSLVTAHSFVSVYAAAK